MNYLSAMSFFDVFPTFDESPYSYTIAPMLLITGIIGIYSKNFRYKLLLHPYEICRGNRRHTLLTSALVHRNWLHLLFNFFVIYGLAYDMYGCLAQEQGVWIAVFATPILFVAITVFSNLLQTLIKRNDFMFTALGASGLSFGLFGFSFFYFPLQKTSHSIFPFIKNSAHYWLYALIMMLLLSFIKQVKINRQLHIIGFLVGSLLALCVRWESLPNLVKAWTN